MSRFRKTAAIGLAACGVALGAYAAERKPFPAENLFPFLKAYYSITPDERTAFRLRYFAVSKKGELPSFKAVLKRKSGDVPITLGAKGEMSPVPSSADIASKAQVTLEAEKGASFGVLIRIVANVPTSARIDAKNVELAVNQAQKGAKKAAGVMKFAVPKLDSACFMGATSGTVTLENGQKIALQTVKSKEDPALIGSPCYTPSAQKGGVTISLDKAPEMVSIEEKPFN
jgi:hypothetical protein